MRCGRCGLMMPHRSWYRNGQYIGPERDGSGMGTLLLIVAGLVAVQLVMAFQARR